MPNWGEPWGAGAHWGTDPWPHFGRGSGWFVADRWIINCYQSTQASSLLTSEVDVTPIDTGGDFVCGSHNTGYGDNFDDQVGEIDPGGYGHHAGGYGHPCEIIAAGIVGGRQRHDLGGERVQVVTDAGVVPEGPLSVTVEGVEAYSGVSGQGNSVFPTGTLDGFTFVMPPLWGTLGDVDIVVTGPGGTYTFASALEVVQHPGRSGVLFVGSRCDPSVNLLPAYKAR